MLPPWQVADVQTICGPFLLFEGNARFPIESFVTVRFFAVGLALRPALPGRSIETIPSRVAEPRKLRRLKLVMSLRMFLCSCEWLLMQ